QPPGLVVRRKVKPRTKIKQNERGLRDNVLASSEERRRIWRARQPFALKNFHHRRHAAFAAACHIDIVSAGLLQGQANELAATLDARPVIKFVAHDRNPPTDHPAKAGTKKTS